MRPEVRRGDSKQQYYNGALRAGKRGQSQRAPAPPAKVKSSASSTQSRQLTPTCNFGSRWPDALFWVWQGSAHKHTLTLPPPSHPHIHIIQKDKRNPFIKWSQGHLDVEHSSHMRGQRKFPGPSVSDRIGRAYLQLQGCLTTKGHSDYQQTQLPRLSSSFLGIPFISPGGKDSKPEASHIRRELSHEETSGAKHSDKRL